MFSDQKQEVTKGCRESCTLHILSCDLKLEKNMKVLFIFSRDQISHRLFFSCIFYPFFLRFYFTGFQTSQILWSWILSLIQASALSWFPGLPGPTYNSYLFSTHSSCVPNPPVHLPQDAFVDRLHRRDATKAVQICRLLRIRQIHPLFPQI